jgi:hypothetical protein
VNSEELQVNVTGTTIHVGQIHVESFTKHPDGSESWKEYDTRESGVKRLRTVYASAWAEIERTNCFCCTCPANNTDPHCRNHGFAGRRPCEEHNLPGTKYQQEHIDNKTGSLFRVDVMPQSVQAYRREQGL